MLDENSEKASEEEKTAINSAKDELKKVLENENSDIEAIRKSIEELTKASQSFAEKLYAESQKSEQNEESSTEDDVVEGEVIEDE